MMYRAKITHCAAIIANLYGTNYPYYVKDKHDTYIEVDTEQEAEHIEMINHYQSRTFQIVETLQELIQS